MPALSHNNSASCDGDASSPDAIGFPSAFAYEPDALTVAQDIQDNCQCPSELMAHAENEHFLAGGTVETIRADRSLRRRRRAVRIELRTAGMLIRADRIKVRTLGQ